MCLLELLLGYQGTFEAHRGENEEITRRGQARRTVGQPEQGAERIRGEVEQLLPGQEVSTPDQTETIVRMPGNQARLKGWKF